MRNNLDQFDDFWKCLKDLASIKPYQHQGRSLAGLWWKSWRFYWELASPWTENEEIRGSFRKTWRFFPWRDQKLRNYMEQVDWDRGIRHDKTPPWSCDRMESVNQLLQVSHIFVIRSGSIFSMAWKFVKGWISPRTASKINVPWLKQRSRECVKS